MSYFSPYSKPNFFRIAVAGCPHTEVDKASGRDSISNFLSQSIRNINPDLWFINGDFFSYATAPTLASNSSDGADVSTQLNSQGSTIRHKIYTINGNHCAGDQNYDLYDRYVDDFGDNAAYSGVTNASRPYTLVEVNKPTHRYAIRVGNMTFIFMGDVNDGVQPAGRSGVSGGRPSGALMESDYDWWASFVASEYAAGQNVITNTHMALAANTTIGTGPDPEGSTFHGTDANLDLLAWHGYLIQDKASNTYIEGQTEFMDWMASNPGKNLACFYAHTHYVTGETLNGRGWTYTGNGCLFVNSGPLSKNHASGDVQYMGLYLEPGSTTAKIYKIREFGGSPNTHRFDSDYILTLTLNFAFEI